MQGSIQMHRKEDKSTYIHRSVVNGRACSPDIRGCWQSFDKGRCRFQAKIAPTGATVVRQELSSHIFMHVSHAKRYTLETGIDTLSALCI